MLLGIGRYKKTCVLGWERFLWGFGAGFARGGESRLIKKTKGNEWEGVGVGGRARRRAGESQRVRASAANESQLNNLPLGARAGSFRALAGWRE